MTYTPTRETLELAALACGYPISNWNAKHAWFSIITGGGLGQWRIWRPHLPTTHGKADLLDMIEATPLDVEWHYDVFGVLVAVTASYEPNYSHKARKFIKIENHNKHAALAEAALKVAAMVGAKIKGGV